MGFCSFRGIQLTILFALTLAIDREHRNQDDRQLLELSLALFPLLDLRFELWLLDKIRDFEGGIGIRILVVGHNLALCCGAVQNLFRIRKHHRILHHVTRERIFKLLWPVVGLGLPVTVPVGMKEEMKSWGGCDKDFTFTD